MLYLTAESLLSLCIRLKFITGLIWLKLAYGDIGPLLRPDAYTCTLLNQPVFKIRLKIWSHIAAEGKNTRTGISVTSIMSRWYLK